MSVAIAAGETALTRDVLLGEFQGYTFGHPLDRMFGGDINSGLGRTDMAKGAGGIDDGSPAAFKHGSDFVLHRIEYAPNIDVEDLFVSVLRDLAQGSSRFHAGIVERDIEAAIGLYREVNGGLHVGIFGKVGFAEGRGAAKFRDLGDDVRAFFFPPSGQDNFGARFCKGDGGCLADARRTAGNQDDLIFIGVSFHRFAFGFGFE